MPHTATPKGNPRASTSEYLWRDRILLFLVWAPAVFYAAGIWAEAGSRVSLLALLALILAPPALTIVSRLGPLERSRQAFIVIFQGQPALSALLGTFALGQLLFLNPRYRETVGVGFVSLELAMLVLMWLFWHRGRVGISQVSLVGTWMLALVTARTTLMSLESRVDFTEGSLLTKAYIGLHIAVLLALISLPLLLANARASRRLAGVLGTIVRQPIWTKVLILAMAASAYAAHLITGEGLLRLELVARLGALAATFALGALLVRLDDSEGSHSWPETAPLGWRGYTLCLALVLLLFSTLAARVASLRLNEIGADGLAYLTIAREYASGELAVRGYWSPLISWAMAPAIAMGASPEFALRLVDGLVGLAWILMTVRLGAQAGLNLAYRLALGAGAGLTTIRYGFVPATPDVLGALLLTGYLVWLGRAPSCKRQVLWAVGIGLWGALAYYGKYYNLPFIFAHILLTSTLLLLHGRAPGKVATNTILALAALGLAILPWVLALFGRYGHLTITTSGPINFALVGPGSDFHHTCGFSRICQTRDDVLFPFEDPRPEDYPAYGWSPLGSTGNFRHFIGLVSGNVLYWLQNTAMGWGALLPISCLGIGLVALIYWAEPSRRLSSLCLLLTILLYPLGYMLSWSVDTRYYVTLLPLGLLAFYSLAQGFLYKLFAWHANAGRKTAIVLLQISAVAPLLSLVDFTQLRSQLLTPYIPCPREVTEMFAGAIRPPFAGTSGFNNRLAYITHKRTLGVLEAWSDPIAADSRLKEFKIETLLAPADSGLAQILVSSHGYELIQLASICDTTYAVLDVPSP